jgi:hypothetical protein
MKVLEIRRHAMRQKPGQHLSQEGIELARRVGADLGPFDIVVTSHLARAIETAVAMGFAVRDTSEDLGQCPETLPARVGWPASLNVIGQNLHRFSDIRDFAFGQLACWTSIFPSIAEGGRGLVVGHGALLELGTIALLNETGAGLDGPSFAYCEGLRIHVNDENVEMVELVRLPEGQRLISN